MRTVALLLFPGFEILDLSVIAVFELANREVDRREYKLTRISEAGGLVESYSGASVDSVRWRASAFDTMLVMGSIPPPQASPRTRLFLRRAARNCRRTGSICTGAFLLAQAGVLDGRIATTHWAAAQRLQEEHPDIRVLPDRIYTTDDRIWTSAGMTSGIDLALAMVEDDLGESVARAVARKLVVYHRRPGGQSQFSALLELQPQSDRIQKALAYARANLKRRLAVDDLAGVVHLSPRQLSRLFKLETGQSPAQVVERLRVDAARSLVDEGSLSLSVIARETGFGEADRMRRAFIRVLGQAPQALRRVARPRAVN